MPVTLNFFGVVVYIETSRYCLFSCPLTNIIAFGSCSSYSIKFSRVLLADVILPLLNNGKACNDGVDTEVCYICWLCYFPLVVFICSHHFYAFIYTHICLLRI